MSAIKASSREPTYELTSMMSSKCEVPDGSSSGLLLARFVCDTQIEPAEL